MKVLMLGWEYPPHIAGGLGVACEGLTKGLSTLGQDITFVIPKVIGGEIAEHMQLVDPSKVEPPKSSPIKEPQVEVPRVQKVVEKISVEAALKPYWTEEQFQEYITHLTTLAAQHPELFSEEEATSANYGDNIIEETKRYAANIVSRLRHTECDLIHAHDWMTYAAGAALAKLMGKPLIVHVHSLEYDRSGKNRENPDILEMERIGLTAADAVIAVSHYTKEVIHKAHGVPLDRIHVVHNGIYPKRVTKHYRDTAKWPGKVVLFLGRITFQKGPEYFVRAAAKVIPHVPETTFVVAGTGDMLPKMIELSKELGVEKNFLFTGFLGGPQVEEIFSIADLYVMPSVSEPFGISALEAVNFDTPAYISKQSGVSEVIGNAVKFNYWDVDRLADFIINGLLHEEMRADMVAMARDELRQLQWEASAARTVEVYKHLLTVESR